jgi:hypothetical protein
MAPNADQLPKQVPWRRSSGPVRRTVNSETPICSLAPSHHGEASAACSSSAEAFLQPLRLSKRGIAGDEEQAFSGG